MTGNILEEVDQEKDDAIIISSDLKCSQQFCYACNKANKVIGMIKRTIINDEFVFIRHWLDRMWSIVQAHKAHSAKKIRN